jgi:dihydropteroate synthase
MEIPFSKSPIIMGILNVTPDSFFDGGKFNRSVAIALQQIAQMQDAGIGIVDIGGESTRPGSEPVSVEEELARVIPILKEAIPHFPTLEFSIDTTKYEVAKATCDLGVHWINDVSGLRKAPKMASLAAEMKVGYMLMHSIRTPKTMQSEINYPNGVVEAVSTFFEEGIKSLQKAGVQNIVLDPGIGFGKSLDHNISLIKATSEFKQRFNLPVLIGASRKRMVGDLLDNRAAEGRLAGSLAVHYEALKQGADIIRVHDIQESADILTVFRAFEV